MRRGPVSVATRSGNESERTTAAYLVDRGYHILERNFRCRGGEVDIIALDGATLVFIEVKMRRSLARGAPIEAVTLIKQSRVRKAAQVYLAYSGRIFTRTRFDVVCVMKSGKNTDITHLKAAFTSTA
ncbi:MAG TPA: YraN family protein [Candidatus Eremiobacteraceae bacterium]|nr:YraN family protein [Candidatus Eremiobacteraceae bacterium]